MSDKETQVKCPNCAELIHSSAVSCRFCQAGLAADFFRPCPFCGEMIRREANLCRFCRSSVPPIAKVVHDGTPENVKTQSSTVATNPGSITEAERAIVDQILLWLRTSKKPLPEANDLQRLMLNLISAGTSTLTSAERDILRHKIESEFWPLLSWQIPGVPAKALDLFDPPDGNPGEPSAGQVKVLMAIIEMILAPANQHQQMVTEDKALLEGLIRIAYRDAEHRRGVPTLSDLVWVIAQSATNATQPQQKDRLMKFARGLSLFLDSDQTVTLTLYRIHGKWILGRVDHPL